MPAPVRGILLALFQPAIGQEPAILQGRQDIPLQPAAAEAEGIQVVPRLATV